VLNGDTTRRTCHCRLESPEERPEERDAFKYPNLTAHVREHRSRLLVDVLTILSAYCLAGRPKANLKPWGSFEGWSDLVRQAVVWVGLEDPGQTRQELTEHSDRDAEHLRELIAGWEEVDLDCAGLTAREALNRLDRDKNGTSYLRLRNVLAEIYDLKPGELPGAKKLGNRLKQLRGRACGGKSFSDRNENRDGVKLWRVVQLDKANVGAGSADSAGSSTALTTRDESCFSNGYLYDRAIEKRAVADPAESADPAPDFTFTVAFPADLTHKRRDCQSVTGWNHVCGDRFCWRCFPPIEASAVVPPTSAQRRPSPPAVQLGDSQPATTTKIPGFNIKDSAKT
jgi:hypothetical protein